jgi:hypothetical protein
VVAIVALSNIPATAADQLEATTSATLPANSVTSATVVNGSLYQQDINSTVVGVLRTPKQNSVTGWSIMDGTVGWSDLTPATQNRATQGSLTDVVRVVEGVTFVGDQGANLQTFYIQCPVHQILLSGGYVINPSSTPEAMKGLQVITSVPRGGEELLQINMPARWYIEAFNNSDQPVNLDLNAWCARLTR